MQYTDFIFIQNNVSTQAPLYIKFDLFTHIYNPARTPNGITCHNNPVHVLSNPVSRVNCTEISKSVTTAAACHHIIILLQNHVLIVIEIQQINAEEFVRNTARHLDAFGQFEGVDDGLHRGVVCGPHVLSQRERTGTLAVVGVVAAR